MTQPILTALSQTMLPETLSDTAVPVAPTLGTPVSQLVSLSGSGSGPQNVTDADPGAVTGIAVTSLNTGLGTWYYYNGTTWNTVGAVSANNALLLDPTDRLYLRVGGGIAGIYPSAVGFLAWDQSDGALHGTYVDTVASPTAFSTGASSASLTVATNPPNVPAIIGLTAGTDSGISAVDGITANIMPVFAGVADPGAVVTLSSNGTVIGTTTATNGGTWTFAPSGPIAEGNHPVTATATNALSAVSAPSATFNLYIDVVPPSAPVITGLTPATDTGRSTTDAATQNTTPIVTGTTEAGATVRLYNGGVLVATPVADVAGNWSASLALANNSTNALVALATDTAGNTSQPSTPLVVSVDNIAPAAPVITGLSAATDSGRSNSDGITSNTLPAITGTSEANSTVAIYEGATLLGTGTADLTGAWTVAVTSPLANGIHAITARATDAAGNTGGFSAAYFPTIDTLAPTTPALLGLTVPTDTGTSPVDAITQIPAPSFVGFGEARSSVAVYAGATLIATGTAETFGLWTVTPGTPLADGTYSVTAQVTDVAGNVSTASGAISLTVDTTIPVAPVITGLTGATDTGRSTTDGVTLNTTPDFTGTAEANSIVRLYDGITLLGTGAADGSGAWTITSAALSVGTHAITATSTDAAGNLNATVVPYTAVIDTVAPVAPAIAGLTTATDTGYSNTDRITKNATPSFMGTAEANAVVTLYEGLTQIGTATADGSGNWTAAVTGPFSGSPHIVTATATDTAGNTGVAATPVVVTVDLTAPGAPTIAGLTGGTDTGSSTGDLVTSNATPVFAGTAEANATVILYDGSAVIGVGTASGLGAWSITSAPLVHGTHNVTAKAVDWAGNASLASLVSTVTVDTIAPTPPTVSGLTTATDTGRSSTDRLTATTSPVFTGTAEAGALVTLYEGATPLGTGIADGSGIWTIAPGVLGAGAHVVAATATDAAGNTSAGSATTTTVTIDTTPPAAPTVAGLTTATDTGYSNTDRVTKVATPTFTGTAEANAVVTLFEGMAQIGTATADGSGNWTATVTAPLSDSPHVVTATATDIAGNTGAATPVVVTVDLTAPAAPAITGLTTATDTGGSSTDRITRNTTPVLTGTAEAGATVTLTEGGTVIGAGTANGSGDWAVAITTPLSGSPHIVTAKATDAAGNASAAATPVTVTVDLTAPGAPTIAGITGATDTGSSSTDRLTKNATPTFTGTAEAGAIVTLYEGGTAIGTGTADGAGTWTITSGALAHGTHGVTARATDAAGNTGLDSVAGTVTIDTVAPTPPVVSGLTVATDTGYSATDRITKATAPVFTGTAEAGSVVALYEGATLLGTGTASGLGIWTIAPGTLAAGTHIVSATATDAAGNTSASSATTATIVIDTTAPGAPAIAGLTAGTDTGSSTTDRLTKTAAPTFTGTAEAGATVTLTEGGTVIGAGTANGSGIWSVTTATLTHGAHGVTARATDAAGNASPLSAASTVTIDTVAPTAPTVSGLTAATDTGRSATDRVTKATAPVATGTAEAGAVVILYEGATLLGTGTADGQGIWTIATGTLAAGAHALSATATDAAGNTGARSAAATVTIDTMAPAAPAIVGLAAETDSGTAGDFLTNAARPRLTGTAEAGATVTLTEGGTAIGTGTADGAGAWSVTVSTTLADGLHNLAATATDAAGNVGASSGPLGIRIDTTPPGAATPGVTDASGNAAGGRLTSSAELRGSGLPNALLTVLDGTTPLGTTMVATNGSWSFALPAGLSGAHSFRTTQTDAAGNVGAPSAERGLLAFAAPSEGLAATDRSSSELGALLQGGTALLYVPGTETIRLVDGNLSVGTGTDEAFVARLYLGLLGREGDAPGISAWCETLESQPRSAVAEGFMGGSEYQARHGGLSDADFVDTLYQGVLGRAADPDGLAAWTQALAGGASRAEVVVGFADSAEAQQRWAGVTSQGVFAFDPEAATVRGFYATGLGREADPAGLAGWADMLRQGLSPADLARMIGASDEFQARHGAQSNTAFVESLYLDGLGRAASAGEAAGWAVQIDGGTITRIDAFAGIATSAEAGRNLVWAL